MLYQILFFLLLAINCIIHIYIVKNSMKLGEYLGLMDIPSKNKIHTLNTPLIGVFSVFIIFASCSLWLLAKNFNYDFLIIFLITISFFILGLIDDKKNLNAYLKLSISVVILLVFISPSESLVLKHFYSQTFNGQISIDNNFLNIALTMLCILLLINALNLSDGINGLASGISAIWIFVLSFFLDGDYKNIFIIISIFISLNTYHIYKGKYFLGDSGTLFLGSLVGMLTIFTYNRLLIIDKIIYVEQIFLFFIIPGVDMFRLFLTRILNKQDPFKGDLNHLHHYILNKNSLKKTLCIYWTAVVMIIILSEIFFNNLLLIFLLYIIIYLFYIFYKKEKFLRK